MSDENKNPVGRPAYEPTDKDRGLVEAMSAYGVPQLEIAAVLEIDDKTLRKHFRRELDTATAKAVTKVGQQLYNKAVNGCTQSQIFFLKTRGKWSETIKNENFDMTPTVIKDDVPDADKP